MRNLIFTVFPVFIVLLSSPAAAQQAAFNEQQALDEIWDAIEGETRCFFARDYECWKEHWVNESHAFQAWNNADGSSDASFGWQAIDERIGNFIKEHPLNGAESSHPIVRRKEPTVKFYGPNCAYLTWKQYNSNRENTSFHLSHEARIMEKVDGRWKIAMVAAFWDSTTTIPIDSLKD